MRRLLLQLSYLSYLDDSNQSIVLFITTYSSSDRMSHLCLGVYSFVLAMIGVLISLYGYVRFETAVEVGLHQSEKALTFFLLSYSQY